MESGIKLQRKKDFETILANYKMSDHARTVLSKTKLALMVGLAASGRNTVINQLLKTGHYYFIVSDTTRPPKFRNGAMEEHGVQYFFRNEESMLEDLQNGEFVEAELIHGQQISGVSVRELERANQADKVAITEVEIGGANNILKAKPSTMIIFMLPPDFETWQARFKNREHITTEEFLNRVKTAKRNIKIGLSNPQFAFVINDTLEDTVKTVDRITRAGHDNSVHDRLARKVAQDILDELNEMITEKGAV